MYNSLSSFGTTLSNLFTPAQRAALQQMSTSATPGALAQAQTPASPFVIPAATTRSPQPQHGSAASRVAAANRRRTARREQRTVLDILDMLDSGEPRKALRTCASNSTALYLCHVPRIPWREQYPELEPFMDPGVGDGATIQQVAQAAVRRQQSETNRPEDILRRYACIRSVAWSLVVSTNPELTDAAEWAVGQVPIWSGSSRAFLQEAADRGQLRVHDVTDPISGVDTIKNVRGFMPIALEQTHLALFAHFPKEIREWANSVLRNRLSAMKREAQEQGASPCMAYKDGYGSTDLVGLLLDAMPDVRLFGASAGSYRALLLFVPAGPLHFSSAADV